MLQLYERNFGFCAPRWCCPLDWQSSMRTFSSWIEEGWARNSFYLSNPERRNPMGRSPRSTVQARSVRDKFPRKRFWSHSMAMAYFGGVRHRPILLEPLTRWTVIGNHFLQHGDIGLTANGAALFGFGKETNAVNLMRANSAPNCYLRQMKGLCWSCLWRYDGSISWKSWWLLI